MFAASAVQEILEHPVSKRALSYETALVISTLLLGYFIVRLLIPDPEAAVVYGVDEPEQVKEDWKGQILENPTLQVGEAKPLNGGMVD